MEMSSPKDSLAPRSLSSDNGRSLWRGGGVEIVVADVGLHFDVVGPEVVAGAKSSPAKELPSTASRRSVVKKRCSADQLLDE